MAAQPNAYRESDGQVLDDYGRTHAQNAWDRRTDDEWEGYSVRAAWREAEPVEYRYIKGRAYARYHSEADVILVACLGFLRTVIPLWQQPEAEQQHVREQVTDE